jgi:thymidine phosphorylase
MRPQDIIRHKRDGGELSREEITSFVRGVVEGTWADYQASALLMAVYLSGMTTVEMEALTQAMLGSGEVLDFSDIELPKADKHSTGGVGDKTSLVIAPLAAACGVAVPMISGRGLGHTGGTLDKLEAIPGYRVHLDLAEFRKILGRVGYAMMGQTAEIAPADKKLYALRDATETVESIPLIVASIMSKKLAAGLGALVLDVKTGSGAFMPEPERAVELARTMIGLGETRGCPTVALVTAMDRPLGRTAGNAVEVAESVEVLAGGGPADVVELTLALAREMLTAAGKPDIDPAEALADGRAMDVWRRMIAAQGGDPEAPLPEAREVHVVNAPAGGTLTRLDALDVGVAAWRLGAGRSGPGESVQAGAGVVMHAKPGDTVIEGAPLMSLHTDEPARFERALEALDDAVQISSAPLEGVPLVIGRIGP